MPLVETESLVIKSYNLAEADKIVVLLTREHGMIRAVAKGAKRLKSKFGSGIEPFSIVKIEYFQKETSELVALQKVDLLQSNFGAASNPDFLQKFSYLGDILITFSPPHDPNETLYRMVKACIETAANDPASLPGIGVYFELWLLRLSGFLPDWSKCDGCGRIFLDGDETRLQSDLHLKCMDCRRSSSRRTLNADDRAVAAAARRLSPVDFAEFTLDKQETLRYLSTIMKQLITQSIGREVTGETSLAISI